MPKWTFIPILFFSTCFVRNAKSAETILFDFRPDFAVSSVGTTDTSVQMGASVLRVTTYHKESWPGVTLKAPRDAWNLSNATAITARVKNTGNDELTLHLRVDNPGADGSKHCLTQPLALKPGESAELEIALPYSPKRFTPVKLFGMRGYPVEMPQVESTLDPANVTQLLFFVAHPKADQSVSAGEKMR